MSPEPEGLREDEAIRTAEVSEERVKTFLSDYLQSRQQSGALEAVFERSDMLVLNPNWNDQHAFGFNVILRKGPFVDRSSWADYRAWQFALAIERRILSNFEELLASHPVEIEYPGLTMNWRDMLAAATEGLRRVGAEGEATCIVVAGPLHENWLLDFTRQAGVKPDWELPAHLNRTWIRGAYHDALIVHLDESTHPALYVVNIPRFARLVQYGQPQFTVDPIDESKAKEILERQHNEDINPESIRSLRLSVWMRLYESWKFDARDVTAVAYAPLPT